MGPLHGKRFTLSQHIVHRLLKILVLGHRRGLVRRHRTQYRNGMFDRRRLRRREEVRVAGLDPRIDAQFVGRSVEVGLLVGRVGRIFPQGADEVVDELLLLRKGFNGFAADGDAKMVLVAGARIRAEERGRAASGEECGVNDEKHVGFGVEDVVEVGGQFCDQIWKGPQMGSGHSADSDSSIMK